MEQPTDATFNDIGTMLLVDHNAARRVLDVNAASKWIGRIIWDIVHNHVPQSEAIVAQRKEWRRALGLPPL